MTRASALPPTSPELLAASTRPYFLWWTDVTVGQLHQHLRSPDLESRAYWMGALLREANTHDVWLFVAPSDIRELILDKVRKRSSSGRGGVVGWRLRDHQRLILAETTEPRPAP